MTQPKPRPLTFAEFWPIYVREHKDARNRRLHAVGTLLGLMFLILGFFFSWHYFIVAPLVGYGFAWLGHFLIERNRPATFSAPFLSFLGDLKMLMLVLQGKMDSEVQRLCGKLD